VKSVIGENGFVSTLSKAPASGVLTTDTSIVSLNSQFDSSLVSQLVSAKPGMGSVVNLSVQPATTLISSQVEVKRQGPQLRNTVLDRALFHDVILGRTSDVMDSGSEMKWSDETMVDDMAQIIISDHVTKKSKPAKNAIDAFLAAYGT
jgi:hypothetical protein